MRRYNTNPGSPRPMRKRPIYPRRRRFIPSLSAGTRRPPRQPLNPPSEKPSIPFIILPIIIIIIIIIAITLLVIFFLNPPTNTFPATIPTCLENWDCSVWDDCINDEQARICNDRNICGTINNKPNTRKTCISNLPNIPDTPGPSATGDFIECGSSILDYTSEEEIDFTNFDCFITASENCESAKLDVTFILDSFGIIVNYTNNMEIQGKDQEECIYYQLIEKASTEVSEEAIQEMRDQGTTQEEINQELQLLDESIQEIQGLEYVCKWDTADLTSLLESWKLGTYGLEDLEDCKVS